ncbi:MAG: glycosyltransferase family 2 protein [Thermodesulfobacteriota bacterium]
MVSIVILTFNALDLTKLCVASIIANTDYPYQFVFVDNASTDGSVEFLKTVITQSAPGVPGVKHKLICNKENRGFAAGCNQGILAADGEYILLLNSDTIVPPGWLSALVRTAESAPDIGIVGPLTNNTLPTQMVQCNYTDIDGMYNFAEELKKKNAGRIREMEHLTGFCMLIKRPVIDAVGLLDENYGIGTFEDTDYCWRARLAGYRLILAEDAFVHHRLFGSFDANKIDIHPISDRNQVYFNEKKRLNAFQTIDLNVTDKLCCYKDGKYSIAGLRIKKDGPLNYSVDVEYKKNGGEMASLSGVIVKNFKAGALDVLMVSVNEQLSEWDAGLEALCRRAVYDAIHLKLVRFPQPEYLSIRFKD